MINGWSKRKGEEETNIKEEGEEKAEIKGLSFGKGKLKKQGKRWKNDGSTEPTIFSLIIFKNLLKLFKNFN